jgi:hypothetical protein
MELRDVKEVQRAHDILTAVILGEVPSPVESAKDEQILTALMRAQLDALCWVLKHEHRNGFPENLAHLEQWLEERGFVLEDHGN